MFEGNGLGYRSEMSGWDLSQLDISFLEVAPENWLNRDLTRLNETGLPVAFHGVSLNLGGELPLDIPFIKSVGRLMKELDVTLYSDHLSSIGDQGYLYDLFPVKQTISEVRRIGDRIKHVQDILGTRISIENPSQYVVVGDMPDSVFFNTIANYADCNILLDLNNIVVNYKNHGLITPTAFISDINLDKVTYCHVAGHYWNAEFEFFIDSHSRHASAETLALCKLVDKPKLLEWDNGIPDQQTIAEELCKISTNS